MVVSSSATGVVHVSPNSVATSRVIVVPDSEVARDGDAISSTGDRQSYNDEGGRVNGGRPGAADEWNRSGPPSLSMSVDLNPNLQDSGHFSASPERVHGPCEPKPELKNDEEESYEAFGSVEGDADDGVDSPPGGSSSAPSPTGTNSLKNPTSPNSTIGRHSWLRTSLRRTPPCSGRKRLSSNALASQLYRSGSFNSSGRGSNCDPADDMYSDVSLEDDVIIGLNHKTTKRKREPKQDHRPAQYVLYSDLTDPNDRDYNVLCEGCEDCHPVLDGTWTKRRNYSVCERDASRNEGLIVFWSRKNKALRKSAIDYKNKSPPIRWIRCCCKNFLQRCNALIMLSKCAFIVTY